jgi:hypothetical protein
MVTTGDDSKYDCTGEDHQQITGLGTFKWFSWRIKRRPAVVQQTVLLRISTVYVWLTEEGDYVNVYEWHVIWTENSS